MCNTCDTYVRFGARSQTSLPEDLSGTGHRRNILTVEYTGIDPKKKYVGGYDKDSFVSECGNCGHRSEILDPAKVG